MFDAAPQPIWHRLPFNQWLQYRAARENRRTGHGFAAGMMTSYEDVPMETSPRELTQNPLRKIWMPYKNGLPEKHIPQRKGKRNISKVLRITQCYDTVPAGKCQRHEACKGNRANERLKMVQFEGVFLTCFSLTVFTAGESRKGDKCWKSFPGEYTVTLHHSSLSSHPDYPA